MSPTAAAPTLKPLTVNVNGLGKARGAPGLFCYQQQVAGNPDFTFVQEVKLGVAPLSSPGLAWPCPAAAITPRLWTQQAGWCAGTGTS